MKKSLIKIVLVITMATLFFACVVGMTACGKNGGNSTSEPSDSSSGGQEVVVTISPNPVTVSEYEYVTLSATVEGSDEAVVWSTSDNSIAEVNENGRVYGVKQGTAEITATAGKASAKCAVTVTKTLNAPVVKFTDEITIEAGKSFEGELKVYFNDEDVTSESEIEWSLSDGSAEDVCDVTGGENGMVTFSAKKIGTATFFVSVTAKGIYVNKSVKVNVIGGIINIVPEGDAVSVGGDGYVVNLCTAEFNGKRTSSSLSFLAFDKDSIVRNAEIAWDLDSEFYNSDIASISGENGAYTVSKVSAGKTRLDGTYTAGDGSEIGVSVNVVVEKATVNLSEHFVIEVENLTEVDVPGEIEETVSAVTLDGKNVLASAEGGKIVFDKTKLPKEGSKLGEKNLTISTANYDYIVSAEIYTLIIKDKADFVSMRDYARANGDIKNTGVLDGYFALGADISYNDEFLSMTDTSEIWGVWANGGRNGSWHDSARYGFKGVFDGKGYNVDGLVVKTISSTESGGILGYMNSAGVFRNVSFTNAGVPENSGYICAIGGGLIENVSISFRNLGVGNANRELNSSTPRRMGAFFPYIGLDGSVVRNCVVNAIGAKIYYEKNADSGLSNIKLGGGAKTIENLIVLCDGAYGEEILSVSGATHTAGSYSALASDGDCIAAMDEFDKNYWTTINGIPFFGTLADKIDENEAIKFIDLPSAANTGSEIAVKTNVEYSEITIEGLYDGITYENGVLKVSETAENGQITLKAVSLINGSTASVTLAVRSCEKVELAHERLLIEATATEIDLSFAGDYAETGASIYYGTTLLGSGALNNGKLTVNMSGVSETGELTFTVYGEKGENIYLFGLNVRIVTKVIRTAKDLAVLRINQTNLDNDVSIRGVYVLAGDIDMNGAEIGGELKYNNSGNVPVYRVDFGFLGTFDGQGHKISNFTLKHGGIFGHVGKGAVIRDVTFDNVTYSENNRTALFAVTAREAVFANITINVSAYSYNSGASHEEGFISSRYMTKCTLAGVTINAQSCDVYSVFGRSIGNNENKCSNVNVKVKSYVMLGYTGDKAEDAYKVMTMIGVNVTGKTMA